MESYTLLGTLVLPDRIVTDGALSVRDGIITYAGRSSGMKIPEDARKIDGLIAPGFVDIHCHAGKDEHCHENPLGTSSYHLKHGTTSMCFTMYRSVPLDAVFKAIEEFEALKAQMPNYIGVHLEGPYLNPKYGAGEGAEIPIRFDEYKALCDTGAIRQWTCSPELEGTAEFIEYITDRGITASIGHSEASAYEVSRAAEKGASLVTHLFDATGYSNPKPIFDGTIEVSFNTACLIRDEFMYEIICDRNGVHVRPELVKLALKTVGIDRLVGITDCAAGGADDGSDVNVVGTDLYGSKMTMDRAARNWYALGLTLPEVFRICSLNPAKAVKLDGEIGSLEKGKRADVLILSNDLHLLEVLKA